MSNTPVPPRKGKKGGRPGPRPQAGPAPANRPPGRRAAAEARRRRRSYLVGAAVVAVVAVIAVIVIVGLSSSTKTTQRSPIPADLTSQLTTVSISTLVSAAAQVPAKNLVGAVPLTGAPLTKGGKPEVLYIGAEYCPICATERWAMTVALSQFGKFSNLHQTRSAVRDGDLATLTYYGSTYTSPYFNFVTYEMYTNQPKGNGYTTLETPPTTDTDLWANTLAQTVRSQPSFPFVDIAGKYLLYTAQYNESDISGLSFDTIAASVGNNSSKLGAEIDASAADLTKYICNVTGDKPTNVCSAVAGITLPPPPVSSASTTPATT